MTNRSSADRYSTGASPSGARLRAPAVAPDLVARDWSDLDPLGRNRGLQIRGAADDPQAHDLEIEAGRLDEVRLIGGRLGRLQLTDMILTGCDWSGVDLADARWERVVLRDSRLAGCMFAGGAWGNVELTGCTGTRLSLRFATVLDTHFVDCDLTGLDLAQSRLRNVRFTRCSLAGAQLHDLTLAAVSLRDCDLSGCSGVPNLRGVRVDSSTLATLAGPMAREFGLILE